MFVGPDLAARDGSGPSSLGFNGLGLISGNIFVRVRSTLGPISPKTIIQIQAEFSDHP